MSYVRDCPDELTALTSQLRKRILLVSPRLPKVLHPPARSPVEADAEAIRAAVLLDEIMQAAVEQSAARIVVVRHPTLPAVSQESCRVSCMCDSVPYLCFVSCHVLLPFWYVCLENKALFHI